MTKQTVASLPVPDGLGEDFRIPKYREFSLTSVPTREWRETVRRLAILALSPDLGCRCAAPNHLNHLNGSCSFDDYAVLQIDHMRGLAKEDLDGKGNRISGARLWIAIVMDTQRGVKWQVLCPTCHAYKTRVDARAMWNSGSPELTEEQLRFMREHPLL